MKYLEKGPMFFGATGFGEHLTTRCSNKKCNSTRFRLEVPLGSEPFGKGRWVCAICGQPVKAKEKKEGQNEC